MMITRRTALTSAAATAAASMLGSRWGRDGVAALTATSVTAATLRPVLCGVNTSNYSAFQSESGTPVQIVRIYHTPSNGIPSSLSQDKRVLSALQAGQRVITSYKPSMPGAQAQIDDFASWCASVKSAGHAGDVWATVWHEPENNFGSGAEYVAEYLKFQPAAAANGIKFGPIFTTYPFLRKGFKLADWMPPDNAFYYIGIDHYAGSDPAGPFTSPLQSISQFTSYAKSRGKVFGIAETGVRTGLYATAPTQAQAVQFIEHYEGFGKSAAFMCMFDDPSLGLDITAHGGVLIPAWKQLYHALTTR